MPRTNTLHEQIGVLIAGGKGFKWQEFVMGMSMICYLIALKLLARKFPRRLFWLKAVGPITACAISIIAVVAGNLSTEGIKVVGTIPKGVWFALLLFCALCTPTNTPHTSTG